MAFRAPFFQKCAIACAMKVYTKDIGEIVAGHVKLIHPPFSFNCTAHCKYTFFYSFLFYFILANFLQTTDPERKRLQLALV